MRLLRQKDYQALTGLLVLLLSSLCQAQPEPGLTDLSLSESVDSDAAFFHDETCEDCAAHRPGLLGRIKCWFENKVPCGHGDADFPRRHIGLGKPLVGTSWLNRPYHFDAFVGGLFGDDLVDDVVRQDGGVFNGVRLGWDCGHFWGLETRLAFADPTLQNSRRTAAVQFFDAHLLYYPWGDAQWRPFVSIGSGIARYTFAVPQAAAASEVVYHLPLGAGLKYLFRKPVALRFEVMDNVAFGDANLNTIHNLSLTASVEWHFGGRRRTYYPYEPSLWIR